MKPQTKTMSSFGLILAALPLIAGGSAAAGVPAIVGWSISIVCGISAGAIWMISRGRTVKLASQLEKLERVEHRYEQLMLCTNDSVLVTDREGRIIEANDTFADLLGYGTEELKDHFLPDLASATERLTLKSFIAQASDEGTAAAKDIMLNQHSGEASWFDAAAIRIDHPENMVQVVLKDITASKRQFILTEKEISFIHELSRTLPLLQDFDQMLDRILTMLSEALPFEGFALVLAEPHDTMATVAVSREAEASFVIEVKDCVKDILSDISDNVDPEAVEFNLEYKDSIAPAGEHVGSQIMLPLAVVNGLAGLFSSKENAFKKEDLSLFSTMVSGISSLYIAYKSYQQVQYLSVTDSLTGLYNRRKFFEDLEKEVERSARYGSPLTLIMLDLDHFKAINDQFGHQMGDEVLKDVADILRANTRKTDVVARYGGEEFIVLLTETAMPGAVGVATRVREAVENAVALGATLEIKFTASLGVGEFQPNDTVDTLIAHTDEALYRAKDKGRNRIELTDRATPLPGP